MPILLLLLGTVYSATAALIWIVRLIASPRDRRNGRLALLVQLLLASALPNVLVSAMGPFPELAGLVNLFVALEPLALAFVLSRAE